MRLLAKLYFSYDAATAVSLYEARNAAVHAGLRLLGKQESSSDHPLAHIALSMNEKILYLMGLIFGANDHS